MGKLVCNLYRLLATCSVVVTLTTTHCNSIAADSIRSSSIDMAHIEVFTKTDLPIRNAGNAKVYYLDGLTHIEMALSQGLPADPNTASMIAKQRANKLGDQLRQQAMEASEGITKAKMYGIRQVPAIVFDQRRIVYGIHDVAIAKRTYAMEQP